MYILCVVTNTNDILCYNEWPIESANAVEGIIKTLIEIGCYNNGKHWIVQ